MDLLQEYDRFNRFANALLSRSNKLSEMISDLEATAEIAKKGPETSEGVRVKKPGSKYNWIIWIYFMVEIEPVV